MGKKAICFLLTLLLAAALAVPASAYVQFDDTGGYTETTTLYNFITDQSALLYNGQLDFDYDFMGKVWAGSVLYIPIGAFDTTEKDPEEELASEKLVKNDNVQLSYKVLQGIEYVDEVTLVSSKKEKLKALPAGMYAKIRYTNNFLPLNKSRVSVRLVLSVNGVSFQDSAITFNCDLQNREEYINRNSIFGALVPAQFRVNLQYKGEASFDFGEGVKYTARVTGGKKYYLNLDRTPKEPFSDLYPDAYLEFYDFRGNNDTFASVGKLVIPVHKEQFKEKKTKAEVYAYEVVGAELKALTKEDIRYNSQENTLTLRTQTLGSYILSSRALMKEVAGSGEEDILRSGYAASLEEPSDSTGTGGSSGK